MTIQKNTKYKILTDEGYVPFDGISKMPPKKVYRLKLDTDYELVATADHLIFYSKTKCKPLGEYKPGDKIVYGNVTVEIYNVSHQAFFIDSISIKEISDLEVKEEDS